MWNTRDTLPLPERIGWVATPIYHDLGHHATLCCATTSAIVKLSEANPQGGQRRQSPSAWRQTQERNRTLRPSTQTLAAVLLLIGWSQRLKKTETPQRKPPKVHGQPDHLPEEPAVTFQKGGNVFGIRGLSPTFSRRSTVSQRLVACGSVASGALRSFLSATCGTPCEKTKPTEVTNR